MNISVLDRTNGTYGIQEVSTTAQNEKTSTAPSIPNPSPLPPPAFYGTWTKFYQNRQQVIDVASYKPRFTLLGLTISEETDSDGLEGYRLKGINRGHHVDEFVPAMDLEKFYERLKRRNT